MTILFNIILPNKYLEKLPWAWLFYLRIPEPETGTRIPEFGGRTRTRTRRLSGRGLEYAGITAIYILSAVSGSYPEPGTRRPGRTRNPEIGDRSDFRHRNRMWNRSIPLGHHMRMQDLTKNGHRGREGWAPPT